MASLPTLTQPAPYTPNKGEAVHGYQVQEHFAQRDKVVVGASVGDRYDAVLIDMFRGPCASLQAVQVRPIPARIGSLESLLDGQVLKLRYYFPPMLKRWVRRVAFSNASIPLRCSRRRWCVI
jgi:hypothetical protein